MKKKMELLIKNKKVLIDEEDFDYINQYNWLINQYGYLYRLTEKRIKDKRQRNCYLMHRELIKAPKNKQVDHINCNKLDNRKENLRLCTQTENNRNCLKTNLKTTSKYKGVSWNKGSKSWEARIRVNKKLLHLGNYKIEEDAAKAYNQAAIEYHKEFAKINEL